MAPVAPDIEDPQNEIPPSPPITPNENLKKNEGHHLSTTFIEKDKVEKLIMEKDEPPTLGKNRQNDEDDEVGFSF
ncbi:unnamed protein product, partial [Mesorhabditis belari]|uniref:Uncharacterized protein n=1 Tax=Mesorhabditis belari TaxID=2138241 RepID=A0AAF3FJL8_9BILA